MVLHFCIVLYAAISHLYLTPFLGSVSEHFLRLGVLFHYSYHFFKKKQHCAYHCYQLIVISYALTAELCTQATFSSIDDEFVLNLEYFSCLRISHV